MFPQLGGVLFPNESRTSDPSVTSNPVPYDETKLFKPISQRAKFNLIHGSFLVKSIYHKEHKTIFPYPSDHHEPN